MKAIQIKILAATNKMPSRLKCCAEGVNSLTVEINSKDDINQQAIDAAQTYIYMLEWNVKISGFGMLPNGDWVATLASNKTIN